MKQVRVKERLEGEKEVQEVEGGGGVSKQCVVIVLVMPGHRLWPQPIRSNTSSSQLKHGAAAAAAAVCVSDVKRCAKSFNSKKKRSA